jgi:hypothetical protein
VTTGVIWMDWSFCCKEETWKVGEITAYINLKMSTNISTPKIKANFQTAKKMK